MGKTPVIVSGKHPGSDNLTVVPASSGQKTPTHPVTVCGTALAGGGEGARLGEVLSIAGELFASKSQLRLPVQLQCVAMGERAAEAVVE